MKAFIVCLLGMVFLTPFMVESPDALVSWVQFIPLAAAAVKAGTGILGSQAQGKAAANAAYHSARAYDLQAREELRRQKRKNRQLLSYQKAATYASGIDFSGSAKQHHESTKKQMAYDIQMQEKIISRNKRAIRKGGQAAQSAANWQAAAYGIKGIGDVFSAGSDAGMWGAGAKSPEVPTDFGNMAGFH
jgi:hypothetical protein